MRLVLTFPSRKMYKNNGALIITEKQIFSHEICHEIHGGQTPQCTHQVFSTTIFTTFKQSVLGQDALLETSDYLVRGQKQLGPSGEFTAHFLSVWGEEPIPNSTLAHPAAISLTLRHQVEAWLGEISPGTQINLTPNAGTDTITLQFAFMIDKVRSNWYRSTNVGYGITYALPILVAVLSSTPGSLLLIENPEAHLHPKGQAQMGDLLARAASGGVQIVVETHSDHVLNGIRVAVHDGKIRPDDVKLHYFQRRKEDGQSQVISPHIDQDGRIDTWPDGFFDEWDKNLEALLD